MLHLVRDVTGGCVAVVANTAGREVVLPPGRVLLASSPLDGDALPADTTVWVALVP